jgi:hypothetical protein
MAFQPGNTIIPPNAMGQYITKAFQPSLSQVHIDRPLTNVSIAYMQADDQFIAGQVFPNIPVQNASDTFWTYPKGAWYRSESEVRAPGTETPGVGFTLGTDNYSCKVYGLHADIADQIRANTDPQINLERDYTRLVMGQMLRRKDIQWASTFFTTGVWGTDLTGVASAPTAGQTLQWNQSASDPIAFIRGRSTIMLEATGYRPNTLVIGPYVLDALLDNDSILARIMYTRAGGAFITKELLASAFGVDRILVAESIRNTAIEDVAGTTSLSFIHGKHALLCYTAGSAGLQQVSAGYTFTWSGYMGGAGSMGVSTRRFRQENIRSDRVECEMSYDMKKIATDLGLFMSGIVA